MVHKADVVRTRRVREFVPAIRVGTRKMCKGRGASRQCVPTRSVGTRNVGCVKRTVKDLCRRASRSEDETCSVRDDFTRMFLEPVNAYR